MQHVVRKRISGGQAQAYWPGITSCSGAGTGFNDHPATDPRFYNLDWMKSIPDETPVSAISIPGTHESLSLHGGPLVICQVWTLDKQLKVGLRYFDVRAGIWWHSQKHLYIRDSHWLFKQNFQFDDVLRVIFNFLNIHSSETVLVKVTLHGLFKGKVAKLMKQLIEKHRNRIWTKLSAPNMQEVRGKIVLLQSDTFNLGTKNHESFFFENNRLINVESKIRKIKSKICDHHIVLTDSAPSRFRKPKTLAKEVNKQLNEFVVQHKKSSLNQGCLGVLSMNFPSANLIKNIIQTKPCICGKGGDGEKLQMTIEPELVKPQSEPNTTPEAVPGPDSTTSGLELKTTAEVAPAADSTTPMPELETTVDAAPAQDSTTSEPESKTKSKAVPTPDSTTPRPDSETTAEAAPAPESTTSGTDSETTAEAAPEAVTGLNVLPQTMPEPAPESTTSGTDSETTVEAAPAQDPTTPRPGSETTAEAAPAADSKTSGPDSEITAEPAPAADSTTPGPDSETTAEAEPAPESTTSGTDSETTAEAAPEAVTGLNVLPQTMPEPAPESMTSGTDSETTVEAAPAQDPTTPRPGSETTAEAAPAADSKTSGPDSEITAEPAPAADSTTPGPDSETTAEAAPEAVTGLNVLPQTMPEPASESMTSGTDSETTVEAAPAADSTTPGPDSEITAEPAPAADSTTPGPDLETTAEPAPAVDSTTPGPDSETTAEAAPAADSTTPGPDSETTAEAEPAPESTTSGTDSETTAEAAPEAVTGLNVLPQTMPEPAPESMTSGIDSETTVEAAPAQDPTTPRPGSETTAEAAPAADSTTPGPDSETTAEPAPAADSTTPGPDSETTAVAEPEVVTGLNVLPQTMPEPAPESITHQQNSESSPKLPTTNKDEHPLKPDSTEHKPQLINPPDTMPVAVPKSYPAVLPNIPHQVERKPKPQWRRRNCHRG
ncbi:mucin-5AC-like [Xiphias gladius]|uniref:mucin-5AC-like n=1 Tax=Xiphias gladius TaxID=8245 RepID=UPI001A99B6C1|nr:mucin-5AC-like [Xiphias gladius]